MLEELSTLQRNAFLDVLGVTLSSRGYRQARDIMRLNDLLARLSGRAGDYGERPYFVSFFGVPASDIGYRADHVTRADLLSISARREVAACRGSLADAAQSVSRAGAGRRGRATRPVVPG